MTDITKPGPTGKWEVVRRLRYGALLKLFRHRYGYEFPDDDAGRDDLFVLLCVVSLAPSAPDKKMAHVLAVWAPWMPDWEAQEYVGHINRLTDYERMPAAKVLGERLNLTNAERERLKLWPIKPADMTVEQLMEQRKVKHRERERRRRRANGAKPRATGAQPWEAEGIPRSTWYHRQRWTRTCAVKTPTCQTIVTKQRAEESNFPRGQQRNGEAMSPVETAKARGIERLKPPSSPDVATQESNIDPMAAARMAALNNWGANAKRKNKSSVRGRGGSNL